MSVTAYRIDKLSPLKSRIVVLPITGCIKEIATALGHPSMSEWEKSEVCTPDRGWLRIDKGDYEYVIAWGVYATSLASCIDIIAEITKESI